MAVKRKTPQQKTAKKKTTKTAKKKTTKTTKTAKKKTTKTAKQKTAKQKTAKQKTAKQKTDDRVLLRPSSAPVWKRCPGSLHIKRSEYPYVSQDNNRLGDVAHKILEQSLLDYIAGHGFINFDYLLTNVNPGLTPDELQALGSESVTIYRYVRYAYNRIVSDYEQTEGKANLTPESKLIYNEGKNYVLRGTADAIITGADSLTVYDLKTGMIEVEADDNAQLEAYAHMAAHESGLPDGAPITVTIIQPSTGVIASDIIEYNVSYFDRLEAVATDTKRRTGEHCKYCIINTVCPELKEKIQEFRYVDIDQVSIDRYEEFSEILEYVDVLTKLIEKIKKQSKELIETGEAIPGWTSYMRNTQRRWIDGVNPVELANSLGLRKKDIVEEKLKTPKAIEQLLKTDEQIAKFDFYFTQGSAPVLKKL